MSSKQMFTWIGMLIMAGALVAPRAVAQSDEKNGEKAEVLLAAAQHKQLVDGDLEAAIRDYKKILADYATNRPIAAKALVEMGECYEKLGKEEARKVYEKVLRDYADQQEQVTEARTRLVGLSQPPGGNNHSTMTARRVWSGPGVDIMGAPSANGRYLSFVDWETGDLALRDMTTGERRHLTNSGSWDQAAEWAEFSTISPDDKQIAFTWYNKEGRTELRVMGLDGSAPRILHQNEDLYYVQPFDWSPDGKQIVAVFTRKDRTSQIVLVSLSDGSVRVLKSLGWVGPGKASFSPDGRYIVYDSAPKEDKDSENKDIFLLATDGSREIPLIEHPANDFDPVWAPDGKHVVFASDRTGTPSLWAIEVADGKPQGSAELIKQDIGRVLPMRFTRQGAYYYGLDSATNDVYIATLDLTTGKVVAPPVKATQRFVGFNSAPEWSPDGQYLAYTSSRTGPFDQWGPRLICIRSLKTGEERELSSKLNFNPRSHLRWSSNGRSLLFAGEDKKGRGGIYLIDAQTGEPTLLVKSDPGVEVQQAEWSPDENAIFYLRRDLKTAQILLRNLRAGQDQERELYRATTLSSYLGTFALSPDGKELAFVSDDYSTRSQVLAVIPTAGGEPLELLRLKKPESMNSPEGLAWTPDGREVLFVKDLSYSPQEQTAELWRISAEGGKPQRLELAMEGLRSLRFHPDGRRIAFTAGQSKAEVWVLDNSLPVLKATK